ncbi:MAG: sigma-54 dependent transcriptional regulator [Bacteroidota bacterium]
MNLQAVKQRFGIIGRSSALDLALGTAVRVATTDLTVLIQGESGVGKEVFSKIIHSLSARKHNNFIAINCGAIPEGTINSELFGHEKGAFTGATTDRKGYFETVDKGTIFLDEIGEMPLDTQAFLLRILESGEFMRVGASKVQKTDVRVIAATNVNLEEKIRNGKFREDLYYRLNTVPIRVPALKERPEDIHMLFRKFAADFAEKYRTSSVRLDERAQLLIENYSWPGNIRELKNVAEQLSVLSEDKLIRAEDMLQLVPNIAKRNLPALRSTNGAENMQEREILYKLLFEMKGDLNDLKSLVFELISSNDLRVPDAKSLRHLQSPSVPYPNNAPIEYPDTDSDDYPLTDSEISGPSSPSTPIILDNADNKSFDNSEIVEENLSLEEMEKEMIRRALDKYKGRRKDAAEELGISERTLYRKIKAYDL